MSACKVAAVVCTAALTAGGAVEVRHLAKERRDTPAPAPAAVKAAPAAIQPSRPAVVVPIAIPDYAPKTVIGAAHDMARAKPKRRPAADRPREHAITPPPSAPPATTDGTAAPPVEENTSGGTLAPSEEPTETTQQPAVPPAAQTAEPETSAPGGTTATPPADSETGTGTSPTEH